MGELFENCPKLGFGLMRLPKDDAGAIDIEATKVMVDKFLAAGGKYFDTAFVYKGSEEATREALCKRHPRSSYYLASKLNASGWAAEDRAFAENEIYESLKRSGAEYFDFYLLHGLDSNNIDRFEEFEIWDYMQDLKRQGLVKHVGFSMHDSAEFLDDLLTRHPETEFVQLQINYADWDNNIVQARKTYEVATKHGVPIIVMEPVKGGTLANPPEPVENVLKAANPQVSAASWAIRFAASLPNVAVVLSGMSSVEQMDDNLSYMKDFVPLSDAEQATIEQAREAFNAIDRIDCTACHYCTPGCPVGIHIPEIFQITNEYKLYHNLERSKGDYGWRPGGPRASECIGCGQCEDACPQHLPIIDLLKETAETFE